MSVLVGKNTRLVVQGMTGSAGAFHARQMKEYGTQVVAGVTPGKAGTKVQGLEEIPVAAIRPNPYQPREHFDEEELASLAESDAERIGALLQTVRTDSAAVEELLRRTAGDRLWSLIHPQTEPPALIDPAGELGRTRRSGAYNPSGVAMKGLQRKAVDQPVEFNRCGWCGGHRSCLSYGVTLAIAGNAQQGNCYNRLYTPIATIIETPLPAPDGG